MALVSVERLGPNNENILRTLPLSQLISANRHIGQPESCLGLYREQSKNGEKNEHKELRGSYDFQLKEDFPMGGEEKKFNYKNNHIVSFETTFVVTNITKSCCDTGLKFSFFSPE